MDISLSRLKLEERLTASLLVFVRGIDVLKAHELSVQTANTQTPIHTPQDMPPGVSSQPLSPKPALGNTQYYIEP